jgi:hypothetical protein
MRFLVVSCVFIRSAAPLLFILSHFPYHVHVQKDGTIAVVGSDAALKAVNDDLKLDLKKIL